MRIAVVGASNSLVRGGLVQGLSDGGLDVVANASLGHSQASILPFRLSEFELGRTPFDHLVVDIATNEQVALRCSLANSDLLTALLDWTLRWCAERQVGVTLVTMPELASYTRTRDLRAFGMRHFLNSYASQRQVQNFDGYAWLEDWCANRNTSPDNSFETPAHMNADIAHAFGLHIAGEVGDHHRKAPIDTPTRRHFRYVPLSRTSGWIGAETIERSTSLGRADLARVSAASDFTLDLERGSIVGLVHNVAGTNASLQVRGIATQAKRLDGNHGDKLVLTAWSLRTPMYVEGRTTLRARAIAYQPDLEHNHVSVWRPIHPRWRKNPTVELAGLVVAS